VATRASIRDFVSTPSDARTAALPARAHHPPTARGEVVDELHGVRVADPYRWLEELGSAETTAWVAAQNEATRAHLATIPGRDALRRRLTELWDYPRVSVPFREAGRLFYRRNSGLERQSVLYERASLDAEPRVVLDPNRLSEDGSRARATRPRRTGGGWRWRCRTAGATCRRWACASWPRAARPATSWSG
jgi:prolyl oligopeptidase